MRASVALPTPGRRKPDFPSLDHVDPLRSTRRFSKARRFSVTSLESPGEEEAAKAFPPQMQAKAKGIRRKFKAIADHPLPVLVCDVRFGDTVVLCDLEEGGFIGCNSVLSDSVYVDAQSDFNPTLSVDNQQEGCFIVVQKFQYTAAKAFEKALATSDIVGLNANNWQIKVPLHEPLYRDLREIRRQVLLEQETNELESKRIMGEPITYGTVVQLRHRRSGKFVTQTKNRAEHDASAMEVALMEGGSEGSWWKVMPADKIRSEGGVIQYSDRVHFENFKLGNSFMTISPIRSKEVPWALKPGYDDFFNRLQSISRTSSAEAPNSHPSTMRRYEVNASPFLSQFQIVPFRMFENSERSPATAVLKHAAPEVREPLHGLDTVTLCHRESETLLVGVELEGCAKWIPTSRAQDAEGDVHPAALWMLQKRLIELGGGPIPSHGCDILLQHVQSGHFLSSEGGNIVLRSDIAAASSIWTLHAHTAPSLNTHTISHGSLVWLSTSSFGTLRGSPRRSSRSSPLNADTKASKSWLSVESSDLLYSSTNSLNDPNQNSHEAVLSLPCALRHGGRLESEDVLEISVVDPSYCDWINYITQCKAWFADVVQTISSAEPVPDGMTLADTLQGVMKHPIHKMLQRNHNVIITCLANLINSCSISTEDDPFLRQGPPRKDRQDLLRQMGFLEVAMELVKSLFHDLNVPLLPCVKIPAIFQVVRRCYLLVERACIDNADNKKSMLKWVPTIQLHLDVHIGSFSTMMAIFSDTTELLESVDEDKFQEIIDGLKKNYRELWVRFLALTCHERDQPMRKNQNILTQLLLIESPELIFQTEVTDSDVIITHSDSCSFSVKELLNTLGEDELTSIGKEDHQNSRKGSKDSSASQNSSLGIGDTDAKRNAGLFRYHVTIMELLGWLVHGRNPWASEIVAANAERFGLSYNQLFRIMNLKEMPYTYRTCACELIKRLYVDQEPHQTFHLVRRTRLWMHLFASSRKNSLVTSLEDVSHSGPTHPFKDQNFERLKIALVELIGQNEKMDAQETRRNIFFSTLVDLVRELTKYGFYHKYDDKIRDWSLKFEEVREIAAMLIYAVDGRTDVRSFVGVGGSDKPVESSINNLIVIEGKIKVLEQLQSFFMCCDNERITDLLQFWVRILSDNQHNEDDLEDEIFNKIRSGGFQWSQTNVIKLSERLFGTQFCIFPASFQVDTLQSLSKVCLTGGKAGTHMDEWSKALLYLMRYRSRPLQELAFRCLVSRFSSVARFFDIISGIQVVRDDRFCNLFSNVSRQISSMNEQKKFLFKGHTPMENRLAYETWCAALKEWSDLCTVTLTRTREDVIEMQRMLSNLGTLELVAAILRLPMKRIRSEGPGHLDQPADEQLRDLFSAVYAFLAKVCDRNTSNQEKLLPFLDLFCSHLGIEGLEVEEALGSLVKDNAEMIALKGKRWIRMFFEDVIVKYRCRRAPWLRALHAMIRVGKKAIKENQTLTMVLFRRYESIASLFVKTDAEWDRRIDTLVNYDENDEASVERMKEIEYSLAVISLLSVCSEGKNPAAEVYAARYLSVMDAVKGVILPSTKSTGEGCVLPLEMECKIKMVYLRFLHDVYSQTNVTRLLEELQGSENGIWAFKDRSAGGSFSRTFSVFTTVPVAMIHGQEPLMQTLLKDIKRFTEHLRAAIDSCKSCSPLQQDVDVNGGEDTLEGKEPGLHYSYSEGGHGVLLKEKDLETFKLYVFHAVFPFLAFYFKARYGFVKGTTANDEMISTQLYEAVHEFVSLDSEGLNHHAVLLLNGELVYGRQRAWAVLRAISIKARLMQGSFTELNRPHLLRSSPTAQMSIDLTNSFKFQAGVHALRHAVACYWGGTGANSMDRLEILKLSLMLLGDNEAVLVSNSFDNPSKQVLLMHILDMCQHEAGSPKALSEILRLVRCSMFLYEPHAADSLPSDVCMRWLLYRADAKMEKEFGPKNEIRTWVQNKYDAMGATDAALRLCAHTSEEVRSSSVQLLLTLLQSGNRLVQEAIASYFMTSNDARFFKMTHETLSVALETLKEYKKFLKSSRDTTSFDDNIPPSPSSVDKQRDRDEGDSGDPHLPIAAEFGKQSMVMLTLRLLQLMCENQFHTMQNMMQKQSFNPVSYDLLHKCIDFLEAMQPILPSTLLLNSGNLAALCMQVLETISEFVQGPNQQNQKFVLSSKFLAVANRILSGLTYCPLEVQMKKCSDMDCSINDLKCWLKTTLLSCCLSLLEGVGDAKRCARVIDFFDLNNFESQLVSIGTILKFVKVPDTSDSSSKRRRSLFSMPLAPLLTSEVKSEKSFGKGLTQRGRRTTKRDSTCRSLMQSLAPSPGWERALEAELFSLYFLVLVISEHDERGTVAEWLTKLQKDYPDLCKHLVSRSSHVEVQRTACADSMVEKVYFRMDEKVIELTENKDFKARTSAFLFNVPRDNPQEKARVFLSKSKHVILTVRLLRYDGELSKYKFSGLQHFCLQRRDLVENLARRLAVLITLFLLGFYGVPMDPNTRRAVAGGRFFTPGHPEPWYKDECYAHAMKTSHPEGTGATLATIMEQTDLSLKYRLSLKSRWQSKPEWEMFPWARWVLLLLALMHVCVTVVSSVVQLTLDFPLLYRECMEQKDEDEDEDTDVQKAKVRSNRVQIPGLKKPLEAMPPLTRSLQSDIIFSKRVRRMVFRSVSLTWYLALKLCISILGLVNSPFFYVAYLLDFFRSSIGRMVLQAIVVGGPNLFRSFILSMIVIVCFGINSYAFFSQSVNVNQQLCHSPFQCVVKHILDSMTGDLTTVLGDDNGNFAYPALAPWEDLWHTWRYFTVFISLVFWVFLLLGIMQGQIIDAFAEMRDQAKAAHDDLSNKCFISSIDRHSFSEYPGEWDKRKDGKFAWNYLHYFCYLQQKDPEEYSGLENAVSEAWDSGSTDFLPIGKFYAGQHDDGDVKDGMRELLQDHTRETWKVLKDQQEAIDLVKAQQEEGIQTLNHLEESVSEIRACLLDHAAKMADFMERISCTQNHLVDGCVSPLSSCGSQRRDSTGFMSKHSPLNQKLEDNQKLAASPPERPIRNAGSASPFSPSPRTEAGVRRRLPQPVSVDVPSEASGGPSMTAGFSGFSVGSGPERSLRVSGRSSFDNAHDLGAFTFESQSFEHGVLKFLGEDTSPETGEDEPSEEHRTHGSRRSSTAPGTGTGTGSTDLELSLILGGRRASSSEFTF